MTTTVIYCRKCGRMTYGAFCYCAPKKATQGEPTYAQRLALYKGKQAAVEALSKENEAPWVVVQEAEV